MSDLRITFQAQSGYRNAPEPMVGIGLRRPDGEWLPDRWWAKVDSGATRSAFPIAFADELGIRDQLEPDGWSITPNGAARTYLYEPGIEALLEPPSVPRGLPVYKFMLAGVFHERSQQILLGCGDFLSLFRCELDLRERRFHLEPNVEEMAGLERVPGRP
jgi:hypothetical protein